MDKGTIIRTGALLLALVNQFLVMFGKSPLPISSEMLEESISYLFTFTTSIVAWYKNNYITRSGRRQRETLLEVKLSQKEGESVNETKTDN
ncbi:phage holin [Virgibacillus kekensis]|uniref:Phage holin n=1 Tax=Virgibacillus kekensis TaxID=202261 RepID=A0ABV9DF00_9BACI